MAIGLNFAATEVLDSTITNTKKASLPLEYPSLPSFNDPSTTLTADADTPDHWIKRHEKMIRLTGKHPFNAEAPLTSLISSGFLTPSSLFYVRNHGAVPNVDKTMLDNWKVSVCGLVSNPVELSLHDLRTKFEVVTLPITLVCAGNRRKEQNIVRKGLGFHWGPGGVSTALFTGVYLADVLAYANPAKSVDGKRPAHVIFEGIDQLPQGPYGTSQRLSWARNRSKGMLIAWAMNGLPLMPDHGFPLRVVIPGQIGGRSVKWLHKIEVSHQESQHYLHFWDNKVLPTQLLPVDARAQEHWWHDPKYVICDLNVNSAVVQPAHDEKIDSSTEDYTIRGYAYSGGGRRVTRVEVSLDEGQSWTLSDINYPEDMYREVAFDHSVFGRLDLTERDECFCWCFWSLEVKVANLKASSSIQVRAMDEGLGIQPRDMYWNATSMMNNWWFRVAIHGEEGKLRFEHPTRPDGPGGWMERMKEEGLDILRPVFTKDGQVVSSGGNTGVVMTKEGVSRQISDEELKAEGAEHPWFVIKGQVYDATAFLDEHPGGSDSIMGVAGQDATEDFMAIHSENSQAQLAQYHIGTLAAIASTTAVDFESTNKIYMSRTEWKKTKLVSIERVSHDSRLFRFAFDDESLPLGLPIGQHVMVRLKDQGGEYVQRAYTPVSLHAAVGYVDLLVKLYLPTGDFVGGKMSRCFDAMELGGTLDIKGPLGSFEWTGKGTAKWRKVDRKVKDVGMICGGSGVTPILQVLRGIFMDGEDTETNVWLLDANRTEKDILCRQEIDEICEASEGRLKLHHVLSSAPSNWKYSEGRIDRKMMTERLPPPHKDSLILICGPPGMITATKENLTAIGWDVPKQLVVF